MKKNDIYLAAAVIAAAFLLWMIPYVLSPQGHQITIMQNGEVVGIYSLAKEGRLTFTDERGGRNVLVIQGGEAYMSEANCPDGLCMRQKAISKRGESIICLPHRLVAEVTAGEEAEMDAVVR